MNTTSQEVRNLMFIKASEIENREEYRKFVEDYCDSNNLDYWHVWQDCARGFFDGQERYRMRNRCIEAVKNTFAYFPTTDLARMGHWDEDDIEKNIEIEEINGKWKVKKIFGIDVRVDNPECRCFALRCAEDRTTNSGDFYVRLDLLTTFDFDTISRQGKEENMVWSGGIASDNGYGVPSGLFFSLAEFLKCFLCYTRYKYDANRLVMVDDTPEPLGQDYKED